MNEERLRLQREVLLDVIEHDKAFDMNSWVKLRGEWWRPADQALTPGTAHALDDVIYEVGCGTASCAYGWLCRDPRGKALGLALNRDGNPTYLGREDFGEDFFELSRYAARWLFVPDNYVQADGDITPGAVIDRIDWLLAGMQPDDFPDGPEEFEDEEEDEDAALSEAAGFVD